MNLINSNSNMFNETVMSAALHASRVKIFHWIFLVHMFSVPM